ncbi:MAG: hypothetical protein M3R13_06510 [Armatimonadota bacterium]|nr:hypothetical protein [Armatimonadota bacterium]
MAEPWDVPRTEEGRDRLIELHEEYKLAGKDREAGICLAQLAYVIKHVGAPNGGNAFAESARLGAEAVTLLRKAGDKKELCRALRRAAVPFHADCAPLLEESLALARELGDIEEEAWTTFAMRKVGGGPCPMTERALALFEQCGSLEGQACCLLTMGFKIGNHNPTLLKRSIQLYEEAENIEEAERGRKFLEVALMPDDPNEEPIPDGVLEKFAQMFATGSCEDDECDPGASPPALSR